MTVMSPLYHRSVDEVIDASTLVSMSYRFLMNLQLHFVGQMSCYLAVFREPVSAPRLLRYGHEVSILLKYCLRNAHREARRQRRKKGGEVVQEETNGCEEVSTTRIFNRCGYR